MKKHTLVFIISLVLLQHIAVAQNADYSKYVAEAEKLYDAKDYQKSGEAYSRAIAANNGLAPVPDRYNAACSWALAGNADSAFGQLFRIAQKGNYTSLSHLVSDPDLGILHSNKKWDEVVALVKQNKDKAEANLNKPLVAILDTVMTEDQQYRMRLDSVESKYGVNSKEIQEYWKLINTKDEINLTKVKNILDKYGWLGADVVGREGNQALFLVIQHADIKTQQKYLPMMRDAVKKGKASPSALALLEDRVALGIGKRQIYGSQVGRDETGKYYVSPLEDPDNVDKRRASVGLSPLAGYLSNWQLEWNVEAYKKQLPAIEAIEQKRKRK